MTAPRILIAAAALFAVLGVALAAVPTPASATAAPSASPRPAPPALDGAEDAPAAIDRLLRAPGATAASAQRALELCRRRAEQFDDRDIARFLTQYGTALALVGDDDAAIAMFARAFTLFPQSRHAPPALLEAARILRRLPRERGGDPDAAERLARRALAGARAMGLAELAADAQSFLARPVTSPPGPEPSP
jgi:tetratricopeptide (TPR) repeat protein